MNIGNVKGNGGIDRSSDRPARTDGKRAQAPVRQAQHDEAEISTRGREAAKSVEALAQRAAQDEPERAAKVEAARQKLQSGDLDTVAVQKDVAQQLLDSRFQSMA